MKRTSPSFALLAVPVLLGVQIAPQGKAGRTAVVDVARLIRNHDDAVADVAAITTWNDEMNAALEADYNELQNRRAETEALEPGSEAHKAAVRELEMDKFRLKMKQENVARDAKQKMFESLQRSLGRVQTACEQYRERQGFDLILQKSPPEILSGSQDELIGEILDRTVLAFEDALEVTDQVMQVLNQ